MQAAVAVESTVTTVQDILGYVRHLTLEQVATAPTF
jgi:hypothetical protein